MIFLEKVILVFNFLFLGNSLQDVPRYWHYQLQDYESLNVETLPDEKALVVIDYSKDGTEAGRFSEVEVTRLKQINHNIVVSYLSIGEAEEYRWYYNSLNKDLLLKPNAQWQGNTLVKYWDKRWQAVIVDSKSSYLSRILEQGFSGVYLDIVDAYLHFPKRKRAAEEMIEFVRKISEQGRKHHDSFKVIVQNAACIYKRYNFPHLNEEEYNELLDRFFDSIYAIAVESVFFIGKEFENNKLAPQEYVVQCLKEFQKRGKPIFSVDYVSDNEKVVKAHELANINGFIGLTTDRNLKHTKTVYPSSVRSSKLQKAWRFLTR